MNTNASPGPSLAGQILILPGEDPPESNLISAKLRWFLIYSTLIYEAEHFLIAAMYWLGGGIFMPQLLLFPLLAILFVWAAWYNRWLHLALWLYAAVLLVYAAQAWLGAANHTFLHIYIILIATLLYSNDPPSQRLILQVMRWLLISVLVGSAIQKWAHGAWDAGEFFALKISAQDRRFEMLYRILGLEAEIAKYQAWAIKPGTGPYSSTSWLVIVLSKGTWLAELLLPLLLLSRRTRRWGVLAIALLMVAIESLAWEVYFGLMVANLLLLYTPQGLAKPQNRKLALAALVLACVAHIAIFNIRQVKIPTMLMPNHLTY